MATITILEKPNSRKKIKVEIDFNQWEKLADIFGLYSPSFLRTLNKSLQESKQGIVRKIKSLRDLR